MCLTLVGIQGAGSGHKSHRRFDQELFHDIIIRGESSASVHSSCKQRSSESNSHCQLPEQLIKATMPSPTRRHEKHCKKHALRRSRGRRGRINTQCTKCPNNTKVLVRTWDHSILSTTPTTAFSSIEGNNSNTDISLPIY